MLSPLFTASHKIASFLLKLPVKKDDDFFFLVAPPICLEEDENRET